MGSYEEALHELQHCVQSLDSINLSTTPSNLYNYKSQHLKLINNELILAVSKIRSALTHTNANVESFSDQERQELAALNGSIVQFRAGPSIDTAKSILRDALLFTPKTEKSIQLPRLLQEEMRDDLEEMNRCYKHECYKAAIILAGKLLETALHKVYYDKTGTDLLQTAPGISIGNLIKKLNDNGIVTDPSLNNQAHFINQVRVQSVHARKEPFKPSREQTQAILLFTEDLLRRLFVKGSE